MPAPILVTFVGGSEGQWRVTDARKVKGEVLPAVDFVSMYESPVGKHPDVDPSAQWVLKGTTSNFRYTTREFFAVSHDHRGL
jgi:hypothetical protein